MVRRRWSPGHWKRDSVLLAFALGLAAYETVIGGGRASVYTFAASLLVAIPVLRAEDPKQEKDP